MAWIIFAASHAVADPIPSTGHYGRILPRGEEPTPEMIHKLEELGRGLLEEEALPTQGNLRAGYTYFGQFIDHDLTFDLPLEQAGIHEPEGIPNGRTPWLDLDQVYGGGPSGNPDIYEGDAGAEQFKVIGKADVPVVNGRKMLGDPRDNRDLENVILLQLHVLFMKLHNLAIKQCMDAEMVGVGPELGTRFARAHRLVVWQYQYLVEKEFLNNVVNYTTLQNVRANGPHFKWTNGFFIPVEFSNVAFRFGHSMVRSTYTLNEKHQNVHLKDLMNPTLTTKPLQDEWVIDWRHFFGVGAMPSQPIDVRLTKDLGALDPFTKSIFSNPAFLRVHPVDAAAGPNELSGRTLVRAARNRLPTGQQVADALEQNPLTADQLTGRCGPSGRADKAGDALIKAGLVDKTPLFFYLLREAQITGGERLGAAGSRIVADVFEGALRYAPDVYPRSIPTWRPPTWQFPDGSRAHVETLDKLVELVGR
jgi:hypothetical protein